MSLYSEIESIIYHTTKSAQYRINKSRKVNKTPTKNLLQAINNIDITNNYSFTQLIYDQPINSQRSNSIGVPAGSAMIVFVALNIYNSNEDNLSDEVKGNREQDTIKAIGGTRKG